MIIKGTLFESLFDTKTNKRIELPEFKNFEEVLYRLAKVKRNSKKDAELMSPATYLPNTTRKNDNVLSWNGWCAVDVDDLAVTERTLEEVLKEKYSNLYYVCYSTASSSASKPKFRLVFPLTQVVSKENIKHFWFALNTELGEVGDIQTKDLSRMYYIPGSYKGANNFIFTNVGEFIDPTELMLKHEWIEKSSNSMFDKLPKKMQEAMLAHRKNSLTNTDVKWTSYRDCPFFPKQLEIEYKSISESGWYYKMYQIMVALAGNAINNKYPITSKEIAYMCRELDLDTGNWYKNRPLDKEADRALQYVYRSNI